jgi:tetratricopeptide (TPR) repeat protein
MEDSTNLLTQEPTEQPTKTKKKDKNKKKDKHTSTWVAVVSALAAIAALVISGWQVHLASKQNTVAEQEQLLKLTTDIAEQLAQEQTTTNQVTAANGTALSDKLVSNLMVEGQAGTVLIDDLKDSGVAAFEYIEVARALFYGGNAARAITYYQAALEAPPRNAVTRASALRYLGILYYQVDQPRIGHQTLMRAAKVFSEERLVANRSYIVNSIAQAYVVDAYHQLAPYKGCSTARDDMRAARKAMGSYAPSSLVGWFTNSVGKAYQAKCSGSL